MDDLLERAIEDAIRNVYRDSIRRVRGPSRRYYNTPPRGGYIVNEEHEYVIQDSDDLSSTLLLDIVTSFGSPGSGDNNFTEYMKLHRQKQIKSIGPYKKVKSGDELCNSVCPICIDQFKEGEYHRLLPCKHSFHKKCIDRWFKRDHSDCPMCRTKIIN